MGIAGLSALALGTSMALDATTTPHNTIFKEDFSSFPSPAWSVAEYDFSHPHFDTDWRRAAISSGDEHLTISLAPHSAGLNPFSSGSVRRSARSHFGRYEAVMQPAKGAGLVTGFFVYTGSAYGTQHDEIDIEFLGNNTRQIHLALFVDGELNNWFVDLGFDAATAPRRYAFDWFADRIIWYVDGDEIFRVSASDTAIPQTPAFLFANLWAVHPSLDAWAGVPESDTHAQATFDSIAFNPSADGAIEVAATMTGTRVPASQTSDALLADGQFAASLR